MSHDVPPPPRPEDYVVPFLLVALVGSCLGAGVALVCWSAFFR